MNIYNEYIFCIVQIYWEKLYEPSFYDVSESPVFLA